MSATPTIDRLFDAMERRLHELRSVEYRWFGFAAIWWDIGLVATPARLVLGVASVFHDAQQADEPYERIVDLHNQIPFGVTWVRMSGVAGFRRPMKAGWAGRFHRAGVRQMQRDIERREWMVSWAASFVQEAAEFPSDRHEDVVDISASFGAALARSATKLTYPSTERRKRKRGWP